MQEGWFPSPGSLAGCSFVDHSLGNQFLDQHTDYTAGHVHAAGQVSTRDRLMFSDQIKSNAPVDVARRSPSSNVEISSIDFAHVQSQILFEERTISASLIPVKRFFSFLSDGGQ